ncbi:hypothetical protein BASA81_015583 [Batrachochytrium salamandrivorans]|nr:hypothetical protein BASA81_015583 [Batrachochytrium salamandrivorans]
MLSFALFVLLLLVGLSDLSDLATAKRLAGMGNHFLVLQRDGQVFGVGLNNNGQLGLNTTSNAVVLPQAMLSVTNATDVSAGTLHSCLIDQGSIVKCTGYNLNRQLGDGTNIPKSVLVPALGLDSGIEEVYCGSSGSCARMTSGKAQCWGKFANAVRTSPVNITIPDGIQSISVGDAHACIVEAEPTQVVGLAAETVVSVACGTYHTCAVNAAGAMFCWGRSNYGQLGNSSITSDSSNPSPVQVTGITSGAASSWAGGFNSFALMQNGTVWAFGVDNYGVFGTGSIGAKSAPIVFGQGCLGWWKSAVELIRLACFSKTTECVEPTQDPTLEPTLAPTSVPTFEPTLAPTLAPTSEPTFEPSVQPTTVPTIEPTQEPTLDPTADPTAETTLVPTNEPTFEPTVQPTLAPTVEPTQVPTLAPSAEPTAEPTLAPTAEPTQVPALVPTTEPTAEPTLILTSEPTVEPTQAPTLAPTSEPIAGSTAEPTAEPTLVPTVAPTFEPTLVPTAEPTLVPTSEPTLAPTLVPTAAPAQGSTAGPTVQPTAEPAVGPTAEPTVQPTVAPTQEPTSAPTLAPTTEPTVVPTATPVQGSTAGPTSEPTLVPTSEPTSEPTAEPTLVPTNEPTSEPAATVAPTSEPTSEPIQSPVEPPTVPANTICLPVIGTDKTECATLMKTCAKSNITMFWAGAGCRVNGMVQNDGGCQCKDYCGYTCSKACNLSSGGRCKWNNNLKACTVAATGKAYVPRDSKYCPAN